MGIIKRKNNDSDLYKKFSFSQCGEDLIVRVIFDNLSIKQPSYIDIGAHHPYKISNTALLYQSGSRGINIEPNKTLFHEFIKYRDEDINLNVGISDHSGEIDFYIINDSTLNTFSYDEAIKYKNEGNYYIQSVEKIPVLTIAEIINTYSSGIFPDFITIDAEGIDDLIIKSIDYSNSFPKVICVESITFSVNGRGVKNIDLIEFIKDQGYIHFADTYLNSIFVKENVWKR